MADKEMLTDQLHSGLQFTKDDLFMNRQGMMTPSQIERAKQSIHFDQRKMGKVWLGLILAGVLMVLARNATISLSWSTLWILGGVFLLYALLFYFYAIYPSQKLRRGKLKVEVLKGQVNLSHDDYFSQQNVSGLYAGVFKTMSGEYNAADHAYVVQVGEKRIYTTKSVHDAFENGVEYSVYFIRANKAEYNHSIYGATLLSAEVL